MINYNYIVDVGFAKILIYKVISLIITLFFIILSIELIIQVEKLIVKSEAKLFRSYITDSFFRLCCPIYFKLCIILIPVTVMNVKFTLILCQEKD